MNLEGHSDWACVHFLRGGFELAKAPDPGRARTIVLDGSALDGERSLFTSLQEVLGFPDYFGRNWDAVDDCLADLDWLSPSQGCVLVVSGGGGLWSRMGRSAGQLVRSWLGAAQYWSQRGVAFHLVFADMGDE